MSDARSARSVTYGALDTACTVWARTLTSQSVPPGARVLVDVDDPLAFAVVHLAVIAAGRCSAPVDPAAPPAESLRSRETLRPALVVTDRPDRPGVPVTAAGLPVAAVPDAPAVAARPGSAVLLTSGSTGAPKAVELAERQMLHVARQVAGHHRITAADRGYNPLPLFHVNAQVVGLLATLVAGAELVLDRRFHRTGFWPLLVDRDVTWVNAAPSILAILSRDDVAVVPPRLRFVRSASAPLPPAIRELISARTGVPVVESYGMTEAASQITATPLDGPARPGSVGRPVGVELQVVDDRGAPCPPDVVGRVRIRGAGVIRGDAGDGWLDTADVGRLDAEGHLHLAGRADDVINRGGELVYPREVEEVLLGDAGVLDAAVVARPDAVLGEVPVAFVRVGSGSVERLHARCAAQLARFKRPVEIHAVDALPVGPTGKVRRSALRERLAAGAGAR